METQRDTQQLSAKDLDKVAGLGSVLQRIHTRLIAEGFIIKDGKLDKPAKKPDNKLKEAYENRRTN